MNAFDITFRRFILNEHSKLCHKLKGGEGGLEMLIITDKGGKQMLTIAYKGWQGWLKEKVPLFDDPRYGEEGSISPSKQIVAATKF